MNSTRLLERFLSYVSCGSESENERAFCEMIEAELKKIGFTLYRDEVGGACNSNGWNVFATMPGEGMPLLFCAHLDTVAPGVGIRPVVDDGVIRSGGDTILGADDKSGVAAVMEAAQSVLEQGLPHRPLEVLFTICEEVGLKGSKHADYSRIKSKQAVVLDSSAGNSIINRAPANTHLYVTIHGKSAHAGVAPEQGVHALKAAAQAVAAIDCGFVDAHTVMNIANLQAPGKTNIVPDKATFTMEIRSFEKALLEAHIQRVGEVVKAACAHYGATYDIRREDMFEVLCVPDSSPLIKRLMRVYKSLGMDMQLAPTYGGSDTTWLFHHGIDALNIGTGMVDVHALTEHIAMKDLETTALAMERLMQAD